MQGDIFKIEGGTSHIITYQVPRIPVALTASGKNTIYAVCHGYGVYYSPNKGSTWMEISGEGLPEDPPVGFNGLLVDPQDENVLYLFGGCDIGMDFKARGVRLEKMNTIYKSENRGKSWTNLNTGLFGKNSGAIKSLSIHPQKSTHLYAGALNGVYFSHNGGKSWQDITDKLPYIHTAGVYLNSNGKKIYAATLGGGVYTGIIQNNSVKWSSQSNLKMQVHHVQVTTHPKDPAIIYASAYPGGVFKSMNQGKTWSEINFGLASFAIKDPLRQGYYAFAISRTKPNILYLGMYGAGMYKSLDKGDTWMPINGKNRVMDGKAITSLLIDPDNPGKVWVTTEEGLHQTEDGGQKWEELSFPGEKSQLRLIKMNKEKKLFVSRLGYELYRSDNSGKDWRPINGFGNFGTFWPMWDDRPLYQYTSLVFHPQDPDILLFGTFPAGIFKSKDKGKTWRESNVGWTNDGVFSMVFHPKDRTTIYCGTYNGVNRSIDTGDSWEAWDKGWPDEQWIFSIDFDPRNPDVIYACSKNGENEGRGREGFRGTVMKSTNGGHDWFPVTKGLDEDQEFYKILVDPNHPDLIYLATQRDGVFISSDGGKTWQTWNEGLSNTQAGTNGNNVTNNMLFSSDKKFIFFGSFGSGIFRRQTIGTAYQ